VITFPDRLTPLMARIEIGDELTLEDYRRLARLQALDIAIIGQEYVQQAIARDSEQTAEFKRHLEV